MDNRYLATLERWWMSPGSVAGKDAVVSRRHLKQKDTTCLATGQEWLPTQAGNVPIATGLNVANIQSEFGLFIFPVNQIKCCFTSTKCLIDQ